MTAPVDISIIVPVWGSHVAYLPPAIESLTTQDGPSLEIVVVDNSSDPPIRVDHEKVRVIRTPRRLRVGAARNFGLLEANGRYVMFWDADDVLLPGALARMTSVLDMETAAVAVTMDSVSWTPETGPGSPWPWPRGIMYRLARHRRAYAVVALLYNPFTTTGPAVMRTAIVRDAGGFSEDIEFFEDWALSGALAVRGRIVMLREVARWYRVHDDSLSLGHLDSSDQDTWLTGMRRRTWRDPRVPIWIKGLRPLVRLHHLWRERRQRRPDVGVAYYESALQSVDDRPHEPPPL